MKNNDDVIDCIRYAYIKAEPIQDEPYKLAGKNILNTRIFLKSEIGFLKSTGVLPKKVIINKNATVLIWNDDQKTIVKLSKEDKFDKEKGFLWAYFLKTTGMSRNQANKYLASLEVEE